MGTATVGKAGPSSVNGTSAPSGPSTVNLSELQGEIAGYYKDLTLLSETDPAEVFKRISAISARAAEIRSWLQNSETRQIRAFKVNQVEPLMDECDRQYTYISRLQAVREFELKMEGKN